MCEESRLDVNDTLSDIWTAIQHLKGRVLERDDVDLSELKELQDQVSNIRFSQKYIPDL